MMFVISLTVALSTGVVLVIGGLVMLYFPPKQINHVYGYRTVRSCKNQRNWDFAQRHSARMMLLTGIGNITVGGAVFVLLVHFGFRDSALCLCCGALQLGLLIPTVLLAIIPTEIALKRLEAQEADIRLRP
ncbi:MAG: SdpI family protein [Kiritimatiellia bacterium]